GRGADRVCSAAAPRRVGTRRRLQGRDHACTIDSLVLQRKGLPNSWQVLKAQHTVRVSGAVPGHTEPTTRGAVESARKCTVSTIVHCSRRQFLNMMVNKWHTICSKQIEVHAVWTVTINNWRITLMLRTVGKIFAGTMTMLCLVSTLAIAQSQSSSWRFITPPQIQTQAQPQSQTMPCTQVDGKGN